MPMGEKRTKPALRKKPDSAHSEVASDSRRAAFLQLSLNYDLCTVLDSRRVASIFDVSRVDLLRSRPMLPDRALFQSICDILIVASGVFSSECSCFFQTIIEISCRFHQMRRITDPFDTSVTNSIAALCGHMSEA